MKFGRTSPGVRRLILLIRFRCSNHLLHLPARAPRTHLAAHANSPRARAAPQDGARRYHHRRLAAAEPPPPPHTPPPRRHRAVAAPLPPPPSLKRTVSSSALTGIRSGSSSCRDAHAFSAVSKRSASGAAMASKSAQVAAGGRGWRPATRSELPGCWSVTDGFGGSGVESYFLRM